jgi:hypothetical protein
VQSDGCYYLNLITQPNGQGTLLMGQHPSAAIAAQVFDNVSLNNPYRLLLKSNATCLEVYLSGKHVLWFNLDAPASLSYFGLSVWQGAATFNGVFLKIAS